MGAILAAFGATLLFAGCAEVPTDPEERAAFEATNDPAEPTNRAIFGANQWFDRNALQPVARAYGDLPEGIRKSIHNFAANLKAPTVLVNDALQANFDRAWVMTQRFVINSTLGVAGFFDVASDWDLPSHNADFGQTFGVWGIDTGPSVQLPVFGPSNVRDSLGTVIGFVANPLNFIPGSTMNYINISGGVSGGVDERSDVLPATDSLEKTSLDYYATLRSIMAQRRAAFVDEGKAGHPVDGHRMPATPAVPDSSDDDQFKVKVIDRSTEKTE